MPLGKIIVTLTQILNKHKNDMAKERDSISSTGVVYNSLTYGSKIIGKIIADKDYRIDGEIEGEIICSGKVVIGQKGLLKGTLQCAFAEILGRVEGKINVSDTLSLRENSVIIGDIKTRTLVVEPKAVLEGTCSMMKDKENAKQENANIASKKIA